jgi:glycosyltransferase involved in cell wall biosynthesis
VAEALTATAPAPPGAAGPAVSIGMPVYNGAEFIRAALDSLLAQSFGDFELIISDNASTDETQTICETYARQDSRITYIRQPRNLGAVPNFLFVLRQARGRYFMWAAHDDIWAENWLETLVNAFRPEDFALRGALHFIWKDGEVVERCPADYRRGQYLRFFMGKETTRNARNMYVYSLFRREQVMALNFAPLLQDVYSWDYLFVFQMIEKGNLRSIPATYQTYRLHAASDGSRVMRQYTTPQRLLFKVHPLSYYAQYVQVAPARIKPVLVVAAPFKHCLNQVQLWWRGFRKIVLGLENV